MKKRKKSGFDWLFLIVLLVSVLIISFSIYMAVKDYLPQKTKFNTEVDEFSGIVVRAKENPGMYFDVEAYMKEDEAYIFLPETADESELIFYLTDEDGALLKRVQHDFTEADMEICGINVTVMKSDLPSINLGIYDEYPALEDVEADKDHNVSTKAYFEMDDYEGNIIDGVVKMRGRGNTSWKEDKKSYQIKFEKSTDLLNMGEAKTWVLLANAGDFSLLRNEVFLNLAADMGMPYTAEIKEVNLFINGEYRGVYSLAEKVENAKNRVELGDGDYLYRIGMDADGFSFLAYLNEDAEGEGNFKKLYGELRDVRGSEKIKRSEQYLIDAMEQLYDSKSDLSLLDVESVAKYYWLQEFSKTTDPTGRSVYLYWISSEGKMYMGPAWDYDRTAGIIEMPFLEEDYLWPTGWTARARDYYPALLKNETFLEVMKDVYENGVKEAFEKAADEVADRAYNIEYDAEMNFIRWDVLEEEESNKVAEVYGDNSWDSQIEWLEDWLTMRCDWIEEEMEELD
ncbi:CotH kinase family protein [Lachnospiraceae bacterium C1.1]|nr:CotH kinase family protein [Lachnospiraceae bacterium C1.1]